jgi:hypothetical protein
LYHRYHSAIALLTWICLLFLVVAVVGSAAVAAVRGLRTWRAAKAVSRAASDAMDDVMRRSEAAEARALSLTDHSERLAASIDRLQRSLEELAILRSAFANARSSLMFRMPTK